MTGQETRNKLTGYWKDHEISKEQEFAILTDIIHREWAGVKIQEHRTLKGLKWAGFQTFGFAQRRNGRNERHNQGRGLNQ